MHDFRLKVFRSAARTLSFSRTAEELYITQPAVTRHIKELENECNVRLFERTGGGLLLTAAGEELLLHAERILDEYRDLSYSMRQLSGVAAGSLRIGASTTIAQYVVAPLLADFAHRFPGVALSMLCGNTVDIEQALLHHDIDLGLVEGLPQQQQLCYTPWRRDELVAVVRADSSLCPEGEITPKELSALPLVMREYGSGTLAIVRQSLRANGMDIDSLKVVAQLGSTEAIKRFIAQYDAMGIVSISAVRQELYDNRLRVVDIPPMTMERTFHIAQRQGLESGAAHDFANYLIDSTEKI